MKEQGFTLVEIMVAIIMIAIGAIGIAQATGGMTRMLSRGDIATTANAYVQDRMERLRAADCTTLADSSETRNGGYVLKWRVVPVGNVRRITLVSTYPSQTGVRVDTVQTSVSCL